jgi:hypothetical protein
VTNRQLRCDEAAGASDGETSGFRHARLEFAQAASHIQTGAVFQENTILAGSDRLHFANLREIHDGGTADAHETGGREPGFHGRSGFAKNVPFFAGVQHDVISGGFDVIDFLGFQKENPFWRPDEDAPVGWGSLLDVIEKRGDLLSAIAMFFSIHRRRVRPPS